MEEVIEINSENIFQLFLEEGKVKIIINKVRLVCSDVKEVILY